MYQIIILCTLNLHNAKRQIYSIKNSYSYNVNGSATWKDVNYDPNIKKGSKMLSFDVSEVKLLPE